MVMIATLLSRENEKKQNIESRIMRGRVRPAGSRAALPLLAPGLFS
jgi:hypothetical protein